MATVGINYNELLKKTTIRPGDIVQLKIESEKGREIGCINVKVIQVFRHHVLLDFGKWVESRRIADIVLGLK